MERIKHLGSKYVLNCVNNKMLESDLLQPIFMA